LPSEYLLFIPAPLKSNKEKKFYQVPFKVIKKNKDKDDDDIVRVSKHIKGRAPKTKKSLAAPEPFDFAHATSVLDAPRSGSEASLLAPTKAAAEPRRARPQTTTLWAPSAASWDLRKGMRSTSW